ncbi:ACT domain-containing protein, partial [Pelomicrobium sp. G1]
MDLASMSKSNRIIVTVTGEDRVGIIAAVATILAEANAN